MTTNNKQDIPEILQQAVEGLSNKDSYGSLCHEHKAGEPMPSTKKLGILVNKIREIIFPGYFGNTTLHPKAINYYMGVYVDEIFELLSEQILAGMCFSCSEQKIHVDRMEEYIALSREKAAGFISFLPELREILSTDVEAAFLGDPAAQGRGEVIFCYPAIRAISSYRIAHKLLQLEVPLIPRMISEMAHSETGIDIHPRAQIGNYFTIDHGTGTVIGATCIIGNNVKLYQGVTLGAKSFPLDEAGNPIKGIPRHPIIEDNVIIYAQATILGRITIGHDSVIGGNVWVTNNLPPYSKVVQMRARSANFVDGAGI
ncbi:serine O-acetyltransferase EpsC [Roseimarinus sediminis]|jgi:serine O-acetyltransferase|uniref:serine O-acetyltransferase EpsC n=1 Tax=Roseimarinus sediminis TaxID=1610899 RepID=UPI003D24BC49